MKSDKRYIFVGKGNVWPHLVKWESPHLQTGCMHLKYGFRSCILCTLVHHDFDHPHHHLQFSFTIYHNSLFVSSGIVCWVCGLVFLSTHISRHSLPDIWYVCFTYASWLALSAPICSSGSTGQHPGSDLRKTSLIRQVRWEVFWNLSSSV